MKITLHPVTIRELFDGYTNNAEEGVFSYGGRDWKSPADLAENADWGVI